MVLTTMTERMFRVSALLLILAAAVTNARLTSRSPSKSSSYNRSVEDVLAPDATTVNGIRLLYRIYESCSKDNMLTCLKVKLIMGLDNAIRYASDISLTNGVEFVRSNDIDIPPTKYKSEQDFQKDLPRTLEEKDEKLNAMIMDRIIALFQTRTLKIDPAIDEDDNEATTWEGRKKQKKNSGAFVMIPLLLGGTFIPIAYGALAFLAGKALIVSKLALVLASIVGIKKLLSGNGEKESHSEVVVSGGHSGGSGWGRDIDLAYSGYNPKDNVKETL